MRRLACNLKADSLYAIPPQVTKKNEAAALLSEILDVGEEKLLNRLNRKKAFVWLKRKISAEELKKIEALGMRGLGLLKESKRFYPNNDLASHILGFVNIDNQGLEGIELRYDKYIKGDVGWKEILRDAKGREVVSGQMRSLPASNGYNVILTIDEIIQHVTEKALDKVCQKYKAKGGIAIVMDPKNGEILALANRPTFNPNKIGDSPKEYRKNRAVTDYFEPGSSFKIITASAALNEKVVDFSDIFFCENGKWNIKGHILHDHKPHGDLTFKQVIEKSSNIGTVKTALLLEEKKFYAYLRRFGFGSLTGVDLPGEIKGALRPVSRWSKFSISSLPIGQEIGVTAMQMASAVSAVANGGTYYRPMIVKEIQDERGEAIKLFEPKPLRRVISEKTAHKMKRLLKGVVENGTGKRAKPEGSTSAGKTGTAQKIEPSGRYSHSKFFSSFVGFAPAEDHKITVCVFVDEPRPVYYASIVAAPVFKEIAQATMQYLDLEESGIVEVRR